MGERSATRYDALDALRGVAIVWMTAFHFCFDLNHFGWLHQDFYAGRVWTWQRTCIVSLFLFCAGLGQAVAVAQGQTWRRFWRRWGQVAGCALLVTVGSLFMFPNSFLYFGVFHGIAVMLVIVRLTSDWGRWLWLAGAAAIASKFVFANDVFNGPWLNWTGWVTRLPITEDYVPLFPWLGVMWWGVAAGQWMLRERPAWPSHAAPGPLAWLGRWSLSWYMMHQPVLIGALMLLR